MLEKIKEKVWHTAPDWFYFIIANLYWWLHPKREKVLLLPHDDSWLLVHRDGSRIFVPRYKRLPFAEPYERYFKVCLGETVLDVGACIGEFTIPAAKKAKEVVAIESNSGNVAWLRKNINENKLQNIRIVEKVAWNRRESLRLWCSEENITTHSTVKKVGRKKMEVRADAPDNIAFELGIEKVDFVKMDIEGAELEALEGAKHILGGVKKIVIETHPRNEGKTTPKVQRFLEARNFRVRVVSHRDSCDLVYGEKCLSKTQKEF